MTQTPLITGKLYRTIKPCQASTTQGSKYIHIPENSIVMLVNVKIDTSYLSWNKNNIICCKAIYKTKLVNIDIYKHLFHKVLTEIP